MGVKKKLKKQNAVLLGEVIRLEEENVALKKNLQKFVELTEFYESVGSVLGGFIADNKEKIVPAKIKEIKRSQHTTIVFWEDGDKTIATSQKGDRYNEEKGLLVCIVKKLLGKKGFYEIFGQKKDTVKDRDLLEALYVNLKNPDKKTRITALRSWEKLPWSVRQSVKAKINRQGVTDNDRS